MKPGALSAADFVSSLPKEAVWAAKAILDNAKFTAEKVGQLPVAALALLQWAKTAVAFHVKLGEVEEKVNRFSRDAILADDERRKAAEYVSHLLLTT